MEKIIQEKLLEIEEQHNIKYSIPANQEAVHGVSRRPTAMLLKDT